MLYMLLAVTFALLAVVAYFAVVKIPTLTSSDFLTNKKANGWIKAGKYLNYEGLSIFYRDSLSDAEKDWNKDLPEMSEIANFPIVLMLHGFPTFSYDYKSMYDDLNGAYHVVAPDLIGAGLSDKPRDIDYTFGMQADMIEYLLEDVIRQRRKSGGLPSTVDVHIVSHDVAVSISHELLARQLDRLRGVSKINSPEILYNIGSIQYLNGGLFVEAITPFPSQKLLLSPIAGPIIRLMSSFEGFSKSFSNLFGPKTKPSIEDLQLFWDSNRYKGGILSFDKMQNYAPDRFQNSDRFVNAMIECSQKGDFFVRQRHINGPADPVAGRKMAELYKNVLRETADLVVLADDIGHYPHLEDSENVNELIRSYISLREKIN